MPTDHRDALAKIKTFDQLIKYLHEELDWPIGTDNFDDLTFEYSAEELGIDEKNAAKIKGNVIKRLRPLSPNQPWGVFFIEFEPKRLPVVALRRILGQVTLKKRASLNKAERQAWAADDMLFVSNYGEREERHITFAHFSQPENRADLPTLKVLDWDNKDTLLHLDDAARKLSEHLKWPADEGDINGWRSNWRLGFTLGHNEVINTARALSIRLAELARAIRDRIKDALTIETERGPLKKLMKAFQEALVHDLNEDSFADMYAQTVAYGLLSARITDPHKKTVDDFAAHMRTNPLLRELMETFLKVGGRRGKAGGPGIDFDELGVSEVVELLDNPNTHMDAVVRDFGDRNQQEDPVIHFYESFLSAYNKQLKIQRGVFYTPQPVVSYIVRSVHELLQTEFGLPDGLADTTTWGDMLIKHQNLKLPPLTDKLDEKRTISPDEPFVQILDPATGTATFLVEAIDVIHRTLVAKWTQQGLSSAQQGDAWNLYVPNHLLPRLHAYELMMAPYAIAHMKVGLKLAETGYEFSSEERVRIYLTNALEPWVRQLPLIGFDALAHESMAVNEIKQHKRFTVVIGNPPYRVLSQNNNPWIYALCAAIKERVRNERNIQPLNDDYVKFLTLSHHLCFITGCGVIGMITNRSFINGKIHPGLREILLKVFPYFRIIDLGGDTRSGETQVDENVFDITQGVAVSLWSTFGNTQRYVRVRGRRAVKYEGLMHLNFGDWVDVNPSPDAFLLTPQDERLSAEYMLFPSLHDLMPFSLPGVKTSKDATFYAFTEDELRAQIVSAGFRWKASCVKRSLYRPMDWRYLYYDQSRLGRPRPELARHVIDGRTISLIAMRQVVNTEISHFGVCRGICCHGCFFLGNKGQDYQHPLQLYGDQLFQYGNAKVMLMNVSATGQKWLAFMTGKPADQNPRIWLYYTYAVFHSSAYRSRYAEFLKIDFPRLPLTGDLELFLALARLGDELVALHLLETPQVAQPITEFIGGRAPIIDKVSWSKNNVWIDKDQTIGFKGVKEEVWNFHIGGYQVCEKWLKDRKGRKLLKADLEHYQKIVVALHETIRIMKEIDKVIDKHGGWPGAFNTKPIKLEEVPQEQVSAGPLFEDAATDNDTKKIKRTIHNKKQK